MGYSDDFLRMWEFYLCYCEGSFMERAISDVHAAGQTRQPLQSYRICLYQNPYLMTAPAYGSECPRWYFATYLYRYLWLPLTTLQKKPFIYFSSRNWRFTVRAKSPQFFERYLAIAFDSNSVILSSTNVSDLEELSSNMRDYCLLPYIYLRIHFLHLQNLTHGSQYAPSSRW